MKINERYWLQPQLQTGDTRIATLIRQTIRFAHGYPGIGIIGKKQPVAIIIAASSSYEIIHLDEDALPHKEDEKVRAEISEFVTKGITA